MRYPSKVYRHGDRSHLGMQCGQDARAPMGSQAGALALPIKGVRDYSCGYRAYRAEVLQRAYAHYGEDFITEQGFSCMVEILCQLNRLKPMRFAEVPLILHYDRKPGETKMRVTKTITDTLRLLLRFRFGG